jgi:hypothetical protein
MRVIAAQRRIGAQSPNEVIAEGIQDVLRRRGQSVA